MSHRRDLLVILGFYCLIGLASSAVVSAWAASAQGPSECFLIMRQAIMGKAPGEKDPDTDRFLKMMQANLWEFYEIGSRKSIQSTAAQNRRVLELASQPSTQPVKNGRKAAIDQRLAEQIFAKVGSHPVASLSELDRYDPDPNIGIGFCFGRAMAVHLEALNQGVDQGRIRKIWAFGKFRKPDGDSWRYHVATAIQSEDGGWWAFDPSLGHLVKMDEWAAWMKSMDREETMQLYLTEAKHFTPNKNHYNRWVMSNDGYNSYFKDLLETFREEARKRRVGQLPGKPPAREDLEPR